MQPLALFTSSHKGSLAPHAEALLALPEQWEIVATDGTYTHLVQELGNTPKRIWTMNEIFGAQELLGGRVKTLTPEIHAALVATPEEFIRSLENPDDPLKIPRLIDLVYVDLYPFAERAKDPSLTPDAVRANIDLGGRALLNSSVKGK